MWCLRLSPPWSIVLHLNFRSRPFVVCLLSIICWTPKDSTVHPRVPWQTPPFSELEELFLRSSTTQHNSTLHALEQEGQPPGHEEEAADRRDGAKLALLGQHERVERAAEQERACMVKKKKKKKKERM